MTPSPKPFIGFVLETVVNVSAQTLTFSYACIIRDPTQPESVYLILLCVLLYLWCKSAQDTLTAVIRNTVKRNQGMFFTDKKFGSRLAELRGERALLSSKKTPPGSSFLLGVCFSCCCCITTTAILLLLIAAAAAATTDILLLLLSYCCCSGTAAAAAAPAAAVVAPALSVRCASCELLLSSRVRVCFRAFLCVFKICTRYEFPWEFTRVFLHGTLRNFALNGVFTAADLSQHLTSTVSPSLCAASPPRLRMNCGDHSVRELYYIWWKYICKYLE